MSRFAIHVSLVPIVALLWIVIFSVSGIYESGRLRGRKREVLLIWQSHFAALAVFSAVVCFYGTYPGPLPRLLCCFGVVSAVALAIFRVALRTGLRWIRKRGRDLCRVVVVGDGHAASTLVQRFFWYPELGMRVVAVLTQDGVPTPIPGDVKIAGRFSDLRAVVDSQRLDQVLIALPPHQQFEIHRLLSSLDGSTVRVRVVPDFHEFAPFACRVEHFEGMPVIRLNDAPIESVQAVAKRVIDIVLSAVGLVLLSPLLILIAALVKLTSRGPILYAQERMGLDGRTFHMLKFRSMKTDAEARGTSWTTRSDDRRTLIGKYLRQTSLDELLQLWNVLVGQMSLVGPRPERPIFVQEFRQTIPDYMLRHKVKSGITGWAQVNGWRGDTSLVERTACDLYYIRNWSLQFDLQILTMTLWKGFINKNAY